VEGEGGGRKMKFFSLLARFGVFFGGNRSFSPKKYPFDKHLQDLLIKNEVIVYVLFVMAEGHLCVTF
jgi:hypothetical protein